MHEVLVNRLGGLSLPRKSVVRLTDRSDMTLDVYRGRKTTKQQISKLRFLRRIRHKSLQRLQKTEDAEVLSVSIFSSTVLPLKRLTKIAADDILFFYFYLLKIFFCGWSGGAMVLGKLPVLGRPSIWIRVGQGPTALAVGAVGVVWTFLLSTILSVLFHPLFGRRPDID